MIRFFKFSNFTNYFSVFLPLIFFFTIPARQSIAGPYLNSAHGNGTTGVSRTDTATAGYATGNCAHCHEQHASIGGSEPVPADGAPSDYLLFQTGTSDNTFCYYCHGTVPKGGADDIETSFAKTYKHDPASTKGTVRCIDCHEPHIAQNTTHSAAVDGNTASGAITGINGVDPAFSDPGDPPADTEVLTTPVYTAVASISKEYQLCLKCHSSYNGGPPTGLSDQGQQFNPYNYAHHPVTGTGLWKNPNIRANYTTLLKAPWNANLDARMYCSDCHGSDSTLDPAGPHGSNNKYLLKAWGSPVNVVNAGAAYCYDALCLLCHVDGYGDGSGVGTPWGHGSNGAHRYEGETLDDNRLGCTACHGGPAGYADFTSYSATSNGGRVGAIHGENFYWQNPSGYTDNPADHFLVGGYNVGVYLANYDGGADGDGICWSFGTGASGAPCATMSGGKAW